MEVRMLFYSAEEIRLIVASRAPVDDTIAIAVDVDTDNEMLELKLIFRFWPKYKTYIAYPVSLNTHGGAFIALQMSDAWFRYLKRELRKKLGVRHLHNINLKDNTKRIEKLLGLQLI